MEVYYFVNQSSFDNHYNTDLRKLFKISEDKKISYADVVLEQQSYNIEAVNDDVLKKVSHWLDDIFGVVPKEGKNSTSYNYTRNLLLLFMEKILSESKEIFLIGTVFNMLTPRERRNFTNIIIEQLFKQEHLSLMIFCSEEGPINSMYSFAQKRGKDLDKFHIIAKSVAEKYIRNPKIIYDKKRDRITINDWPIGFFCGTYF